MIENRKRFIDELNELNEKVCSMGYEIIESYNDLLVVFETSDLDVANNIIEKDKLINELEISINVDAYLLIAKQCPVASDLRRIITALKISNELERIGDYAVNISKYIIKTKNDNKAFVESITKLTIHFIGMLSEIMKAFEQEDMKLALDVNELDEDLDEQYKQELKRFIKIGKNSTDEESEEAIRAVIVLKQIERAGDHVTNIAENIVYLVNGKRVELN